MSINNTEEKIIKFQSMKGDDVTIDLNNPRGVMFMIIPDGSIEEVGALDVFQIGLKRSETKKLVRSLKYGKKFYNADNLVSVSKDFEGNVTFSHKLQHTTSKFYKWELRKCEGEKLIDIVENYLATST